MANAKTGSFCLKEDGIHIETNGLKFKVSYEQVRMPFDKAKKWCAERGGDMFSFEEGIFTAALLPKINKALLEAGTGEHLFDGWYWFNQENPVRTAFAYNIYIRDGYVDYHNKDDDYGVRAVFTLE